METATVKRVKLDATSRNETNRRTFAKLRRNDLGLPIPRRAWSASEGFVALDSGAVGVRGVSDQHLHLTVDPRLPIHVGNRVACVMSHPCTAFDKWPLVFVVDDDLNVINAVRTFF